MTKLERNQMRRKHFLRNLRSHGLKLSDVSAFNANLYGFKDQRKPCSCSACKRERYSRSQYKRMNRAVDSE